MNRIYRVVWSAARKCFVVASEIARSICRGTSSGVSKTSKSPKIHVAKLSVVSTMLALLSMSAQASDLPTGANTVFGQNTITQSGNTLNINQQTQNTIVNWDSFGIASGHTVNVNQPAGGSALYRVMGNSGTEIFGALNATGKIFLINPNGVLFGQGSEVNVGSLVASSLNIKDEDYLSGNFKFNAGPVSGSVENHGAIKVADEGFVVLMGPSVSNTGSIIANKGSVSLASGNEAYLDFFGNGLVKTRIKGDAATASVINAGSIHADGGYVSLSTSARASAINVSGIIEADSLVERNGVIRLEGGDNAQVSVSGQLLARGNNGLSGGDIQVTGEQVALFNGSIIDASGETGGGKINIGGGFQGSDSNIYNSRTTYVASGSRIDADATIQGDGGNVVIWSNGSTKYYGDISSKGVELGNGGFVEVSGKSYLDFVGSVDLSSKDGSAGTLLLDPLDIILTNTAASNKSGFTPGADNTEAFNDDSGLTSTFNTSAGGSFANVGNGSTIVLQATRDIKIQGANTNFSTATGNQNVNVELYAGRDITTTVQVTTTGTGRLVMAADSAFSGLPSDGVGSITLGGSVFSSEGSISFSGVNFTASTASVSTGGTTGNVSFNMTGDISYGTGSITANGKAATTSGINAGNITMVANSVTGTGAISALGSVPAAGSNSAVGGNGGNVSITTNLNSSTGTIQTYSAASGSTSTLKNTAGNVSITSNNGNVSFSSINAYGGTNGAGGNVNVSALNGTITATSGINTSAGSARDNATTSDAGSITLISKGNIGVAGNISAGGGATGAVGDYAGGNGSNIYIESLNGDVNATATISTTGGSGKGAGAGGNGGNVTLIANGSIAASTIAGSVNSRSGNAGATSAAGATSGYVSMLAKNGNISTSSISSLGATNGDGGNVSLEATNGSVTASSSILTSGGAAVASYGAGYSAGNVSVKAKNNISLNSIIADGTAGVSKGGNGGNIAVESTQGTLTSASNITSYGAGFGGAADIVGGSGGSISLRSYGDMSVGGLITSVGGSSGTISSQTSSSGAILLNASNGSISTQNINSTGNINGKGNSIIVISGTGSVTTGELNTKSTSTRANTNGLSGGDVTVSAAGNISILNNIYTLGSSATTADYNGGNSGNVSITSTGGSINLSGAGKYIQTNGGGSTGLGKNGNGGNFIVSGYGDVTINSSVSTRSGQGSATTTQNSTAGNIAITSTTGNVLIKDQLLAAGSTNGWGGNVSVIANNGYINASNNISTTGGGFVSAVNNGAATVNSGNVTLSAKNDINLAGNIVANGISNNSGNDNGGNAGDVNITSTLGNVSIGTTGIAINAQGGSGSGYGRGGYGGDINISANGNISLSAAAYSNSGSSGASSTAITQSAGDISIHSASGDISLKGATANAGSNSYSGSVNIIADTGSISSTSEISTKGGTGLNNTVGSTGSALNLTAVGSLTLAGLNTSGGQSSGTGRAGDAGDITLVAANGISVGTILTSGGKANLNGTDSGDGGDINITNTTSGSIASAQLMNTSSGLTRGDNIGQAGNISIRNLGGSINLTNTIRTGEFASQNVQSGNITLVARDDINATSIDTNTWNNDSHTTTTSGNVYLEANNVNVSSNITTRPLLNGTNVGSNGGDITVVARNGDINIGQIQSNASSSSSGISNGNAGNISLTATGNITTTSNVSSTGAGLSGRGGNIAFTSGGNIVTTDVGSAGGNLALSANGNIDAASINASGRYVNGAGNNSGNINVSAGGYAKFTSFVNATGSASATYNDSGSRGGDINISAQNVFLSSIQSYGGASGAGYSGANQDAGRAGNIAVNGNLTLNSNGYINASGFSNANSGNVTFNGDIDSISGTNKTLTVSTYGTTTFNGNIGSRDALSSISTDHGLNVFNGSSITTTGSQSLSQSTFSHNLTINAGSDVTFNDGGNSNAGLLNVNMTSGNFTANGSGNHFSSVNINNTGNTSLTNAGNISVTGSSGSFNVASTGNLDFNASSVGDIALSATNIDLAASGSNISAIASNGVNITGDVTSSSSANNSIVIAAPNAFNNGSNHVIHSNNGGHFQIYTNSRDGRVFGSSVLSDIDYTSYGVAYGQSLPDNGNAILASESKSVTLTLSGTATKYYDGTVDTGSFVAGKTLTNQFSTDRVTASPITTSFDQSMIGSRSVMVSNNPTIQVLDANGKPVYGYGLNVVNRMTGNINGEKIQASMSEATPMIVNINSSNTQTTMPTSPTSVDIKSTENNSMTIKMIKVEKSEQDLKDIRSEFSSSGDLLF